MKMDLINTEEYPQADRQYKDRLFRFIFQRPADLPDLYNAVNGTDYSDPGALECETVMLNIMYAVPSDDSVEKVVVDADVINMKHEPQIIRKSA